MEEQAQSLLAALKKTTIAVDTKVGAFNNLKSSIKHQRVPESCQPAIFECIKLGIGSQASPALVTSAFATLGHLIKRLSLQEQASTIAGQAPKLLPILQDRLADAREPLRNASSQILADLWPFSKAEVERVIREGALAGTSARAKEMAMLWVVKMNRSEGLPFRSFVPSLVTCLEDSDGGVRETAKSCVVELFRSAPEHAKADLKKQMAARDVRKTIMSFIVQNLGMHNSVEVDLASSSISLATTANDLGHSTHVMSESVMSELPPSQEASLEPLYIHTQRELEEAFREMQPPFEGKETEHNWLPRDKSIRKLRRLLQGNAPSDFHAVFVAGIINMRDNILKVTNTLRTTMSSNACQLVQELYRALGTAMDPITEIFLQNFIKMSANTKQIAAKNADTTMEVILSNCTFNQRLLNHIWQTFGEKNIQTRSFAPGWLKVLMKKNASHKAHIEHSGAIDLIEKCLKKGLEDANPKVRESTRGAYWVFAQVWPDHSDKFMASLDDKMRNGLEKDPNNPNKMSLASSTSSLGGKTKAGQPVRPSIRDAIVAQRKAAMTKNLPERPSSAQSTFSTTDAAPTALRSAATRPAARPPSALSKTTDAQLPTQKTLTSGPARRPRRPEISRPATADPYATRKTVPKQGTPTLSPQVSPSKGPVPKPPTTAPRTIGRTPVRPNVQPTASTIKTKPRGYTIPKSSPGGLPSLPSSPSKDENLTMVVPFTQPPDDITAHKLPVRSMLGQLTSPSATTCSEDDTDGFTMVLPTVAKDKTLPQPSSRPSSSGTPSKSHLPRRSPIKPGSENAKPLSTTSSPNLQRKHISKAQSPEHAAESIDQTDTGAVQVYEDPFEGDQSGKAHLTSVQRTIRTTGKSVLEEIPVNERNSDVERDSVNNLNGASPNKDDLQRTPRHFKTTSTGSVIGTGTNGGEDTLTGGPQPSADVLRSRRLLTSAIERVRAKTLDAHGFRKVQELVRNSSGPNSVDVWGDDKSMNGRSLFGELLLALLEYLESPIGFLSPPGSGGNVTPGSAKTQNLKTQVLATVRAMMALHKREAITYNARALCAVLVARKGVDEMSHLAAEMERLSSEIVRNGTDPGVEINAVLELVDKQISGSHGNTDADIEGASGTLTMALSVLAGLLGTAATKKIELTQNQTKKLGSVAVRLLQDPNPEVRRADLEFCLELHEKLGAERFWSAVKGLGAKESGLNLITYYLARRGKA